jgi:DNA-binding protein H-NS
MNILQKANEIVNTRSEEKTRQYGPFEEGMAKAAKIASLISSKEITTNDMYNCMIALKLSRQSYSPSRLKKQVGWYYHFANNMHLYEQHLNKK